MKKRTTIIGFTLTGLVVILVVLYILTSSTVGARPVQLVITGPEGQRFSGSYVADGITNSVHGIAPATISFQARNVAYEFKREDGDAEFRVALFIGHLCRLSTTSDKRQGVRGKLSYSAARETCWAETY